MSQKDIDQQMHAARKHSTMRENLVGAALGVKGYRGMKWMLPVFTADGGVESPEKFRTEYDKIDWTMPCQGCGIESRTSYHKGKLVCDECKGSHP